jgi:hypothetical protein
MLPEMRMVPVSFRRFLKHPTVAKSVRKILVSGKMVDTAQWIQSRDAPDTLFAGYPANPKAGYRISGKGRIPDIRPDT